GLAVARAEGRVGGRRRIMTTEVVARARRMFANGASMHQVALVLEVSPKTIYKYIPAEERHRLI
ncbi:TPA: helix-turn-helix domain-containing protein, partial [Yersinia enterocolitica]|nr:helix-turn-helix domain-containing protein [Yersinia enterocolitica]